MLWIMHINIGQEYLNKHIHIRRSVSKSNHAPFISAAVKSIRLTTIRCPLSASIVHGRDWSPHLLPSVSDCCRVLPKSTMCCGLLDTDTVQKRVSAATEITVRNVYNPYPSFCELTSHNLGTGISSWGEWDVSLVEMKERGWNGSGRNMK